MIDHCSGGFRSVVSSNAVVQGVSSGDNFAHNLDVSNFDFVSRYDPDLGYNVAHNTDDRENDAGVGLVPDSGVSLGQSKRGSMAEVLPVAMGDVSRMGMKGSVGVASSPVSSGKPLHNLCTSPVEMKSKVCLSLIENSSDNMAVLSYYGGGYCFWRFFLALGCKD
jgi:hypothetical protein